MHIWGTRGRWVKELIASFYVICAGQYKMISMLISYFHLCYLIPDLIAQSQGSHWRWLWPGRGPSYRLPEEGSGLIPVKPVFLVPHAYLCHQCLKTITPMTYPYNSNHKRNSDFTLIVIVFKWSLQNFAHATTAVLLWHVQNFVVIQSPRMEYTAKCYISQLWNFGWWIMSKTISWLQWQHKYLLPQVGATFNTATYGSATFPTCQGSCDMNQKGDKTPVTSSLYWYNYV